MDSLAFSPAANPVLQDQDDELALGAYVIMTGLVVGRSEFQGGPPSYLVQFQRKGLAAKDWFLGSDLEVDGA